MLCCSSCIGKSVPGEYRKAAEALFPPEADRSPEGLVSAARTFARALGVAADYEKLDKSWNSPQELAKYLRSFRNNLDLLIQKTWVEKADEDRKERLLSRIPAFISLIEGGDYSKALGEFGLILEELAWLLFGAQSRREDFFEYAFRIDYQMGLFWWYSGQLERFLASGTAVGGGGRETLRALLLLGICYLTDF
jgi:hypothetical protein